MATEKKYRAAGAGPLIYPDAPSKWPAAAAGELPIAEYTTVEPGGLVDEYAVELSPWLLESGEVVLEEPKKKVKANGTL